MIRVVQFSGGKDSTALVLWAREQWGEDFTPVFMDTGWEHPVTYEYVAHINATVLAGRLLTLRSEKYPGGMRDLVAGKGIVPSPRKRFCTEELKVKPFIAWMRAQEHDEATVYQGIRADESVARSAMPDRQWNDEFDAWIERPVFRWTAQACFDLMARHGIEPNPLYKAGSSRVGCFPCIMHNLGELRRVSAVMPEIWDRAAELEGLCKEGGVFFRWNTIPARFCSRVHRSVRRWVDDDDPNDVRQGEQIEEVGIPSVEDVKRYVLAADEHQLRFWDRCTPSGCLSVYNLCE